MRLFLTCCVLLAVLAMACAQPQQDRSCAQGSDCGRDEYCSKTTGSCGSTGICAAVPAGCTQVSDPVCGCDGTTYPNRCEADRAGTSIASTGACAAPPQPAGCVLNTDCAATDYCAKPKGSCDLFGSCVIRPHLCIALWDPVTGCDGRTYGNACEAARQGVNIR